MLEDNVGVLGVFGGHGRSSIWACLDVLIKQFDMFLAQLDHALPACLSATKTVKLIIRHVASPIAYIFVMFHERYSTDEGANAWVV